MQLDAIYRSCDFAERIGGDPIEFPHRYSDPRDVETAGLIAAVLAYGKVDLFKAVIERILSPMGASPAAFLADFSRKRDAGIFSGIYYRFNTADDIILLLHALHRILKRHGSIERALCRTMRPDSPNVKDALTVFVAEVHAAAGDAGKGFSQMFPSPASGSACKRLNLYLRWMVRTAAPDFGIWHDIRPDQLVIPLDLHISRIGRCLGLTERKSDDWKTAVEITESLKRYDPHDPLKYDFALCHLGITRECGADKCSGCEYKRRGRQRGAGSKK